MLISEMVAGNNGIGFFILAVVGYLLNRAFVLLESRALVWYLGQTARERG